MKNLFYNIVLPVNLSKTLLYSSEYRLLYGFSRALSFFVQPPRRETNPELISHLRDGVLQLHRTEAENIRQGLYPISVLKPRDPVRHLKLLPKILLDSVVISRRRRTLETKELKVEDESAPDYLKRNYHFQTDGYFSQRSASFYEQQVEILFSGTAAPMRRMLIAELKKKMTDTSRPLRILEIGAGVGSATIDFLQSFQIQRYVMTDVSEAYLNEGKQRLLHPRLEFQKAAGEELPFADRSFDLVFSVFLFHELPRSVRTRVLSECARVLSPGGLLGICDSLQRDDDPRLNQVLDNFPVDYHEPFYKDYILWETTKALEQSGFRDVSSTHHLLSKYWVATKA